MRLAIAVPLLAVAALLAGCGDQAPDTSAADPSTGSASSAATSPTAAPVSLRKSCAELYRPPAQLMPRAIEFVHGSPSAEDSSKANDLVDGLVAAASHASPTLVDDIEVVHAGVQARLDGQQPTLADFDRAVNRLGGHCELYGD